jgi:hypothetical protein
VLLIHRAGESDQQQPKRVEGQTIEQSSTQSKRRASPLSTALSIRFSIWTLRGRV